MRITTDQIKEYIHESNLIENVNNKIADDLSYLAWIYLSRIKIKDLQHKDIRWINCLITTFQDEPKATFRGHYRDLLKKDVIIGGDLAVRHEFVGARMDGWLELVKEPFSNPMKLHIEFERIHPFLDGNGRTGRLLLWWMQDQLDEKPSCITYRHRSRYYRKFRRAQ